ncbi:ribonuclease P protein component (plasmid) [Yersinia ruckeri]|nr:ribonuclease P protein component [Yersinia ruckeri]
MKYQDLLYCIFRLKTWFQKSFFGYFDTRMYQFRFLTPPNVVFNTTGPRTSYKANHMSDVTKSEVPATVLIIIATECFRRSADNDYLAARICYSLRLTNQFWWMAEQAIEKKLKAIFLYHGFVIKKYSHELNEMLKDCQYIGLTLTEEQITFIEDVNIRKNRYLAGLCFGSLCVKPNLIE